ncbi:type II secretion system minor pseudopilin GspK [Psychrobacter cryohalolentis]|uniref:Type II secretion system protein K n=1 Tax=Psychrobacter cryohalolentis (strain ATCC BAA-1226 / DSM 17306 / VKM B-2378 / K5) TaxID=335284 RepID=Q1QAJ7_PSYCK|nr:type II secretion system minor pseudopilin GspK [Psychrobacter cryohalolentis]ABE75306.1 General secretion pathway protein K [Psychrobacter cryohalolentis K5]ASE25498.1 general secretion pathway protein GspK [Psychrobacter cryohalolentis]
MPSMPVMPMKVDSQRGVALLTILLLVVSITVVAGAILASQKIAIRRSGLLFDQNQLLQDIDAGQQLAVTMIRADANLNDTDSTQDIWAKPVPPYTLGTHSIGIEIRDEASRFNINNLYQNGAVDSNALAVLQRLLIQLNLAPDIAIAVLDYQDADSEVYQDGGDESTVYNQQSNSSADNDLPNQRLVNIDQLQNVKGINAEVLAVLRPYITVVPHYLPINMNTASPVILAALIDGATSQKMQTIVDLREKQVFESIDEIWQLPILSSLDNKQRKVIAPLLAVDSQAFTALITATDNATVGQARQRYATIMISKTATDVTENSNNVDNANSNNKNADNKKPKEVRVLTQRLWAFRPNF